MAVPKLKYGIGNAASTTLSSAVTNTDTSMTITSDTNFAAKSGEGMIIVDEDASTEEYVYSASKSSNTLSTPLINRGLEGGSAQAHASTASVKGILTVAMWNDLIDSLLNVLDQTTGSVDTTKVVTPAGSQTLTNKTMVFASNTMTNFASTNTAQTFTNKRTTKRTVAVSDSATPTINTDNTDVAYITGLSQAITSMTTNLSGTPVANDALIISITDNGTARAITWGASFESSGNVTLPTTTVLGVRIDIGFLWNTSTSKWRCVGVA